MRSNAKQGDLRVALDVFDFKCGFPAGDNHLPRFIDDRRNQRHLHRAILFAGHEHTAMVIL